MANKKKKTIVSYKDYKKENGTIQSYGDYRVNAEKERKIQEQRDRMAAVQEQLRQRRKQERERKEKMNALSSRNTDVWHNNAVSNQNKTGNTFQTYQEKMNVDTHGGLSGEGYHDYLRAHPTPEMKQTDEWRKLDKKAKYSPELKDESAYIAKMMYDSHTQTPTQSKYIPGGQQLKKKETAADKTGQSMGDYLAGIKQKKEEKTKQTDWQAQTAHAQNSADPRAAYGSVYQEKATQKATGNTDDWARATQASTLLANNQNLAYGAKMAGMTPEEFVQQLQGTNKQLTQQEQKDNRAARLIEGKTDLGHWMGGTTEDVQETMRSGYASGFRGDLDRLKDQGYYDEGDDPYLMSDEGRANLRAKYETGILSYQKQLEELEQQIAAQEKPANGWDPLLELYSTPEIENERKIIEGDGYTEEEKRAALEHLNWLLNRNTGYGSQSANDRARNFYRYNIHNLTDLRDNMNMDNMRRMAYDAMNGNGAYEKATAGMNPEERAALDDRIDNVLDYIADPDGELGVQKRTVQGQIEYTQSKIDEIDRLNEQNAKYAEMMEGVDELGDVQIDPATVGTSRNKLLQNQYTPAHPVEYVAAILSGDYNEDVWINDLQYGQALLMSDDEKKKFADLYNNGKKNEAWAFYQGLEPMLNQMYHYFEDLSIRQTARRIPITSSIATEAMHLAQPVEALINLPEQLASAVFDTGSGVTDPYSSRYLVTRLKNGIRAQVASDVGDWDWVYNGVMSGVDSALNVAIGKGLGLDGKYLTIAGQKIPAMQAATLGLFHTQAFETSLQNTLTQGNDQFGYDFIEAWIDAAVETATEIWSVENWMADPTNILRYVAKIAISEPSEEIVGAIIEPYVKEMLGHKNQYKERAKQILADGGYTDGQGNWVEVTDMDTATRQAMREWNHDIRMAAQEALLSVGPSIVYGSAQIATDTNRTGRAIQSNNIAGEQIATRELAEAAAKMNPETESFKQSQKMLERLKKGEKISNYDAGKLATNIIRETNEQIGNTARQVLEDRVAKDLQDSGMKAEEAQKYAGLITSAIEEGGIDNLSQKDRSRINSNNAALQTYMSYRFNEETQQQTEKAQREAAKTELGIRSTAESLLTDKSKQKDLSGVGLQMAAQEDIDSAEGERITNGNEVIHNGRFTKLLGVEDSKEGLKFRIQTENGTQTVNSDAILATDAAAASIIRQATVYQKGLYSADYVNKLLENKNSTDIKTLLRDAKRLRIYGYLGMEMPETPINRKLAIELYNMSLQEHAANRKAQVGQSNRQTQGRVTYKGFEYGTTEWNNALKGIANRNVRAQMDTIAGIAQRAGIEVTFMDLADTEQALGKMGEKGDASKYYGWENRSGISVNMEGLNYGTLDGKVNGKHNMVVTFGHEMTHWLQRNSLQGYNRLENFVMSEMIKNEGMGQLIDRLDKHMRMGENLEGAMAEVVANSCDQILSNEKVIEHIQNTDKSLYQEVKNFVKDLVNRVKNAIKGMSESASYEGRAMIRSTNELAKNWLGAYDEALTQAVAEDTKIAPAEEAQFSKHIFNGKEYILVEGPAFDGRTDVTQAEIRDYLAEQIGKKLTIIESGQKALVTKQTTKEYAYSGNTRELMRNDPDAYAGKANAASQLDEIVGIAHDRTHEKSQHKNAARAKYGVYKYNTEFAVELASRYVAYEAEVDILNYANGNKELYDLVIKNEDPALEQHLLVKARHSKALSSINNITENEDNDKSSFSKAQMDSEYMAAVESGDMETAHRLVEEAAKRAGYDTPKLYHGTRYFGFTEFDIKRGEGLVFATSDRKVAESYSGETERSRISDKTKIDANNLHGNRLLNEARKYIKKYNDYKLLKQTERETEIKDAKYGISFIVKDLQDYLAENKSAFDDEKMDIANRIVEAIDNMTKSQSQDDIILAWNAFDTAIWDMKFMDESRLEDMLGRGTMQKLNRAKNWLNDLYYEGELFVDKFSTQLRVYDTQLALETNAKLNQGVYELYGRTDNQLVIDANGDNWNQIIAPEELNLYGPQRTRVIAEAAYAKGYDSVLIKNVKDSGGETPYNWPSDVYIYFNASQVKSADTVTYDDQGNVIKPSKRFNSEKTDIRFSQALTEEQQAEVDAAEEQGIDLNMADHTASRYSRASYMRSEYYKDPKKMARELAKNVLGSMSRENVAKATKWIQDVTSISALIGEKPILDYVASPGRSSFKSNPEYGGSIDSSTICAKRRLQTGTIDAIQRALPEYVMSAEDFLQVRRMMKERGYEVSCGLCFVESSRKNIAKYASQFMREWNSQHPENQVNMTQINTVLGLENTRLNNKEVYDAYEKFMNKLAQRKPKLFEMRSEYNNDILKHFRNDASVEQKNKNGGMRINSFSDFEIVHLIDMMQVIMDMSNVGLAGQAYTKVREFAEALGPTGLKINMSMIAAGVDENGRIIFDEVEGMKWDDVEDLRNKYADNVGTVCVVFTEDQLMAGMADDRIDYIIPFHRSQWNKSNYKDIGMPENVKDFTYWQNERYAKPVYGTKKDGTQKKLRPTNYMPNEYWDPNKSGKENAEAYLRMCYENNKIPKFWKWLQSNGDGSYSLKADGSTDGYWKLLGDFKMYNHLTGDYAPQLPVQPNFDMNASQRMLKEYQGGHETFPEATDVVNDFVAEKKKGKKGITRGKNGQISLAGSEIGGTHFSRWTEEGLDVDAWMQNATPSTFQTEDEEQLWKAYRGLRTNMSLSMHRQMLYKAKIAQLESKAQLTAEERDELTANRNRLEIQQQKMADLEDELYKVTSTEGYAGMMYRQNMVLKDYIQGKTQEQVMQTVDGMLKEVQRAQEEIRKDQEALRKMAETQAVKTVESYMSKSSLGKMAGMLRSNYNSSMGKGEIQSRLAEMALKQAQGEDITSDAEQLAQDLLDKMRGIQTDALQYMKGTTLRISEELAKEMKAENLTMADLRRQLKGSGVTIKTEKGANIRQQWAELYDKNQSLPNIDEDYSESGALHHILDFIQGEVEASRGVNQNDVNFDEVAAVVKIAAGNITTYLVDDPAARRQIENLMGQVKELAGKTGDIAQKMEELDRRMDDVVLAGQKAKGWTTILQRDVKEAIRYYNTTARVAAEKERAKVRKALIEQLRSENTKKLLEQQDAFRERLKNDQKARELAHDNGILRNKISTVATRMANRIFAETDQKNVPEEAKAMVRQVLYMISQHDGFFRKVTYWDKQQVENIQLRLAKMINHYGQFNPDTDLEWLVVKAPNEADNDYSAQEKVIQDLVNLETGLMEYRNAEGRGRVTLQDRKDALTKVQEALSEIWDVVKARSEMEIAGRKWQVYEMAELMREGMAGSRFKGERKGFGSRARNTFTDGVTWGNLTPEYFFKNLRNQAMSILHSGLKDAENRSGLEAAKAKERLAEIAEKNGFASWDGQEEHKIKTRSGEITMTTEQIMSLYATWLRESNALRPEDTAHLLHGGFVLAEKENNKGLPGREKKNIRPIRMSQEHLDALGNYLTEEQLQYVNDMVAYMSGELAELGNEASMKMYGIKKFTEKYYFPIKSWGGVLNKRSDAGISTSNENRAAQQGFSKRIKNNASNAIEIGDFTPTAIKHVAGMITYNTVGPAIENLNKVLNQQLKYGEIKYTDEGDVSEDDTYKLNMRAAFENAYGKQASDYLAKFMKDMNGGVTTERTAFDKMLSMFKKNAVAGSLSVAAQQPLSYIRAAMMINPKYLAEAISPQYWKGSYKEMMDHSGIAVIKKMGKFDMNFGQTMQEWIKPEGMQSKARKAWNKTTDVITGLPNAMDAMTWTRMWTAVKLEQMAQNKGMDYKSDDFMNKVAERFNDLMRQTQVYDSVMTKSQNMRSQHWYAKTLTSFMAEPTLSLNVLADAFQNVKEKGGKLRAIKAVATFLLSAAAQAGAKAFFGAGRSPDKKKNKEENFLNKFGYNILSEVNPLGLIPGYRQIIDTLTDGEFQDDTMGMVAKASEVVENIWKLATGKTGDKGLYRDLEDSIGQFLQLTTDIPAKNMMRDFRAMVNWFTDGEAKDFTGDTYAQRPTSSAVLKYQVLDTLMSTDLIGLINKKLGEAGYGTAAKDYYPRIYEAEKAGNKQTAEQMKEYLILKSTAEDPEKTVDTALRKLAKEDESLTAEERYRKQKEYGLSKGGSFITDEYEAGNLTRKDAERLYREENPKATDKDVLKVFDKIDWEKAGNDAEGYTNYTPLMAAIEDNKAEEIRKAVDHMVKNGYSQKDIRSEITSRLKKMYNEATSEREKLRIRDALTKTYKALGYTANDADETVQKWINEKKKNK